jgi:hypothetical protein
VPAFSVVNGNEVYPCFRLGWISAPPFAHPKGGISSAVLTAIFFLCKRGEDIKALAFKCIYWLSKFMVSLPLDNTYKKIISKNPQKYF